MHLFSLYGAGTSLPLSSARRTSATDDFYLPAFPGIQYQRPDQRYATSLVGALKPGFRAGDGFDGEAPECRFLTAVKCQILLQPRVSDVKCTYLGSFSRAVKMAIL